MGRDHFKARGGLGGNGQSEARGIRKGTLPLCSNFMFSIVLLFLVFQALLNYLGYHDESNDRSFMGSLRKSFSLATTIGEYIILGISSTSSHRAFSHFKGKNLYVQVTAIFPIIMRGHAGVPQRAGKR